MNDKTVRTSDKDQDYDILYFVLINYDSPYDFWIIEMIFLRTGSWL